MQAFFTWFDAFLSSGSFWVYIVIFFGKVLEVSEEEAIDLDELEDMFPDDFCGV